MSATAMLCLLEQIERLVPPPNGFHHLVMAGKYGSDATGWVSGLYLQVNDGGVLKNLAIRDRDFDNFMVTAETVAMLCKNESAGAQRGREPGVLLPAEE
jgi:hypothetical protein